MSNILMGISNWLTGHSAANPGGYMPLTHCMAHDYLWIGITVALDLSVAAGYVVIARHWWINEKSLPNIPAKRALRSMKNIFIFCGLCGYLYIPVKMVWPAWRLYDMFLAVLVYFTWRYAYDAGNLKVVYTELGKSAQLLADLEQSRLESHRKSSFLNAISHDLRTPLNGLLLQASLAEITLDDGDVPAAKQAIAQISSSARATSDLLHSLLECARLDYAETPLTASVFNLTDLLTRLLNDMRPLADKKGLELRLSGPAGVMARSDAMKLERVMQNLLSNAIKFTDAGTVRVDVQRGIGGVEIHVIDTGVGIDPKNHARLFDEFFQIHNEERDRSKGFGLGLAIAARLARLLGGEISVESAPGHGSRFSVALPGCLAERAECQDDAAAARCEPLTANAANAWNGSAR